MNNLKSFSCKEIGEVYRISYTYVEIAETGKPIKLNGKGSIYAVDSVLRGCIQDIFDFIQSNNPDHLIKDFMILNMSGIDRAIFRLEDITHNIDKKEMYLIDTKVVESVAYIRKYIMENRLGGD